MLTPETLPALQRALADAELDGWLLYDFQGNNPIAGGLLALEGMVSRRVFVFVPRDGLPQRTRPRDRAGTVAPLAGRLAARDVQLVARARGPVAVMVRGKRIAMEYSAGDAVPYLDRVPAGVLEMVRAAGATEIVSSGELVTRFYASWSDAHLASHRRAAETIATIAHDAFALAGERARRHRAGHRARADAVDARAVRPRGPRRPITGRTSAPARTRRTRTTSRRPSVRARSATATCCSSTCGPPSRTASTPTRRGWPTSATPSTRAQEIWTAMRDARDAAIRLVQSAASERRSLRGADVDDAARQVIVARGFGDRFTHRTGHSIDPRSLHGSGPHLDNLETREERLLVPGVGFSIEPGIYIPGEIGMRSEVNAFLAEHEAVITPVEYQRELIVV